MKRENLFNLQPPQINTGFLTIGRVNNSHTWGSVAGYQNVGGLVGNQNGGKMITYSSARGEVTGTNAQGNMPDFDWVNSWKTSQSYSVLKAFTTGGNNIQ